jgi:hypothetical protein
MAGAADIMGEVGVVMVGAMTVGAMTVGATLTLAGVGATVMEDMAAATLGAAIMPEADMVVATASWAAADIMAALDSAAEIASTAAAASMVVVAASTAAAEVTVVDTGNPLLQKVRTAGSMELPAVLFLRRLALGGRPANSAGRRPLYLLLKFLLEWRVAELLR